MAQRNDFGISKIDFLKLHPVDIPADTVRKIVDSLDNGVLIVHPSLKGLPDFNLEKLNWGERFGLATASQFQLYLHSLNIISYLTRAFELYGKIRYLELAKNFLDSWIKYSDDIFNIQINNMLSNSQCVALRTVNIAYFVLVANDAGFFDKSYNRQMIAVLKKHGDLLCDEKSYRPLSSQGAYQNRSLLYLSVMLEAGGENAWYKCAKERIKRQIENFYTDEMVSIENSYVYQLSTIRILREIAGIFNFVGDEYGKALTAAVEKGSMFLTFMLKPDLIMPMIGDTKSLRVPSVDYKGLCNEFEYAATAGKSGKMPEQSSAIFPKAGYFAAREFWSPESVRRYGEKFSDSAWVAFRSGCLSKAHKHVDDLSFMFYAKGHDIFTDSGFYSFDTKNVYRRELTSASAHNTVIVDGMSYEPECTSPATVGISDWVLSHPDGYDYVCGYNNSYGNVGIERHFYYFGNAILIFDDIHSLGKHVYSQFFHLGEDISIINGRSTDNVLMKIDKTGYFVRIRQLSKKAKLRSGCPVDSKISRTTNVITSSKALIYDVEGVDASFVTLITIENGKSETSGLRSFDYDASRRIFSFITEEKSKEIHLATSKHLGKLFVKYTHDDNDYIFTASAGISELKYAWYVYEKPDSNSTWILINKTAYTRNSSFLYHFGENSEYRVKVFACNGEGEQISAVAANLFPEDLAILPQINVTYAAESNRFRFVNKAMQDGMLYAWYVYRSMNGEWEPLYKGIYTDSNKFEYTFNSGCQYRVRAFILGKNGSRRDEIVAEIEL